jgi:hypothetical protein
MPTINHTNHTRWSNLDLADRAGQLRAKKAAIDEELNKIKLVLASRSTRFGEPKFEGVYFDAVLTPPGSQLSFKKDRLLAAFPGINLAFFSEETQTDWALRTYPKAK